MKPSSSGIEGLGTARSCRSHATLDRPANRLAAERSASASSSAFSELAVIVMQQTLARLSQLRQLINGI
jgi:hypothetical protein